MILMNDFKAEPTALREAMLNAVARVLDSGWYVLGREVVAFEQSWAARCGVAYGVGVGNGMDAIEITLRALGIGAGDEVVTTPMTAFATVLAIIRAGATPVLADIDLSTGLLSLDSTMRCLTPRTKAIVLVHLYGQLRSMDDWSALAANLRIHLVEDCAQSHGATWRGKAGGAFGIAGAYSFYPTKNLGTAGDGGMIVASDEELVTRMRRIRNYGQSVRYEHPEVGMNSRLDEIHAAMLSERLVWLEPFTARRREIAAAYRRGINNPQVRLLAPPEDPQAHVFHLFVVICSKRDALQAYLQARNVQALIHYPIPMHRQVPCTGLARDPEGLSNTEQHAATCLSLPCHPQMTDAQVHEVITAINAFSLG